MATSAADIVGDWLRDGCERPLAHLPSWRSGAGGQDIAFQCTDRWTAEKAADRLMGPRGDHQPRFRLSLLETDVLGWPHPRDCDSEAESLALTRHLGPRGISAIIPVGPDGGVGAPWVMFDATRGAGCVVVRSVEDLPPWMVNAPFSLLLHLALAACGQRLLHAASLGLAGRGALVVGPGGAGKSATTIAGILAGLDTVGDDYLAFSSGEAPSARPVYRVLKQSPAGLARFPALRARTSALPVNWHGKIEFDAELARPGCMTSELAIDVILIPRQTGAAKTAFVRSPATAAFSALAPSTLSQLPGDGLAGFAAMARLTRQLPAFWADLSTDADEVGVKLRAFLADRRW